MRFRWRWAQNRLGHYNAKEAPGDKCQKHTSNEKSMPTLMIGHLLHAHEMEPFQLRNELAGA